MKVNCIGVLPLAGTGAGAELRARLNIDAFWIRA